MAQPRSRTPLRILAPLALVAAAVALFLVITGSGGGDSESGSKKATETSTSQSQTTAKTTPARQKPAATTYTVKAGDNLGSIAEKTEVPVAKLQEINPDLDPQALVSGQKIKLRE